MHVDAVFTQVPLLSALLAVAQWSHLLAVCVCVRVHKGVDHMAYFFKFLHLLSVRHLKTSNVNS